MSLTKGIHHVAIKGIGKKEYEKLIEFYVNVLGMEIYRNWGSGEDVGALLDTGNGYMEIFSNGTDTPDQSVLRHIAFDVKDTDACVKAVKDAGYTVTVEPRDIVIGSQPPVLARIAFCIGPVGETVEFFQTK